MALSTTARYLLGIAVLCSFLEACIALPVRSTASSPQPQPTATATLTEGGPVATQAPTVPSHQPLTSRNNTLQQNSTEPEQPSASPKLSPDQHEASPTPSPRPGYTDSAELVKLGAAESSQSASRLQQQLGLDRTPKPVPACFVEPRDPEDQPNSTAEYIPRLVSDYQSLLLFIDYAKQVVEENPGVGSLYQDYQRKMTNLMENTKQLVDIVDSDALEDPGETTGLEEPVSAQCSDLSRQQQYHTLNNYISLMGYIIRDIIGLLSN